MRLRAFTPLRLGLRDRIWVTVVSALAVVLVGLTVAFNVVLTSRLDDEANTVASSRAAAEIDGLRVTATGIRLTNTPDVGAPDTPTWVFEGAHLLERPHASAAAQRAASALAGGRGFHDVRDSDTRLYALPVLSQRTRVGTVVAAVALGPYDQIQRLALAGSAILAALALLAVALAARWLIARALAPVEAMTRQAAEWSAHDLPRRFLLGPPHDEFTTLAATLDGLLDRVAASLRHEQLLTAELSHELRTPLSAISAEAQFALRHGTGDAATQDGYRRIHQRARHMTRLLDTLLAAARAQAISTQPPTDPVAAVRVAIHACTSLATERDIDLSLIEPPDPVLTTADPDVLERVLSPLLENACRYAVERIEVEISDTGATMEIAVQDDGPGIAEDDREAVFAPGVSRTDGEGAVVVAQSAGLGLALARRLAQGIGADVILADSTVGARFVIVVPRA